MNPRGLLKGSLPIMLALFLIPFDLFAWTNGELLIWMDADRGHALEATAKKFEHNFGLKVTIAAPEKITDSFPIAAQMAKGPDIVIWAHDKVGEWADAGLIAPTQISEELGNKIFPKAWQAVLHREWIWGYPIALETVTLIYNKKLLDNPPPAACRNCSRRQSFNCRRTGHRQDAPVPGNSRTVALGFRQSCPAGI